MAQGLPCGQRFVKLLVSCYSPDGGWLARHTNAMRQRRPNYVRQWRTYRGLSQEKLADRLHISKPQLSRIENGKRMYTQDFLEACAEELNCDPVDLLIRDPTDPEGIWTIWEHADTGEKRQIVELAKVVAGNKKAS